MLSLKPRYLLAGDQNILSSQSVLHRQAIESASPLYATRGVYRRKQKPSMEISLLTCLFAHPYPKVQAYSGGIRNKKALLNLRYTQQRFIFFSNNATNSTVQC
jgi:hypothetical protein